MRLLTSALSLLLLTATARSADSGRPEAGEPVSYYSHIRPIFQANCQGCHQPAKVRGKYIMTDFEKLLAGGDNGVAIVPGEPEESYLVELITPVDGEAEMPQKKDPLPGEDIALVRRWIAEGAEDDTPENARRVYSAENPPLYTLPPVITALDFSPDGRWLAVSGFHEVLLHRADGSGLEARLVGLSERIESVAFSPDGTKLAVTGGRPARMGEVQIWDVAKRKLEISHPVSYDTVYGASWSPDGRLVAFGCSDTTVRAIDAETGKEVLFQGAHDDWVFDTVFSVEGTHIASVSRDMTAKLTEVATQRFVDNITSITPGALSGGMGGVDRHPARDEILVGGSDGVPKIYQMHRTTARQIGDDANLLLQFPGLEGRVFSVDFNADGSRVAAGSSLDGKGHVRVYGLAPDLQAPGDIKGILQKPTHTRSGEEIQKMNDYFRSSVTDLARVDVDDGGVYAVTFSPDGATVAFAGSSGSVHLVDASTGEEKTSFMPVKVARHKPEEVLSLTVEPESIRLDGKFDYRQLLVTVTLRNGERADVTRDVRTAPCGLVAVDERGLVKPASDGRSTLQISYLGGAAVADVPVEVTGMEAEFEPDYVHHIMPVVSKLGCNAGTCHGSKDGKNGFKLSLRGYDPVYDTRALTDDIASRRVNVASPENSLMLLKATAAVPHEGGQVTKVGSDYYKILESWIAAGAHVNLESTRVKGITVSPQNPVVQKIGDSQQVRVIATYADGRNRDVTREAFIESGNTEVATTDKAGLVTTVRRGEAPILARFEGAYAATTVTVMGDRSGFEWVEPPAHNEIDRLVAKKLQRMKILSSETCTDVEFVRRVHLDLTGLPPTPDSVDQFLSDPRPSREKRDALIDALIGTEDYIELWTNKWADLLQVNRKFLGADGARAFRQWIRGEVANNTPYDDFARKILTATGSNRENPPASYYKILRNPTDMMENTTHLFLGVRFNCNKCHDHPFERWTQDNYYELSAFFSRVDLKKDPEGGDQMIGGTAVESGKPVYEIVYDKDEGEMTHERTGKVTAPSFPYAAAEDREADAAAQRREQLAAWITAPDNRYFASSYVNRVWGYLTGTGLIEPLDDIRAGNPPSNPELLDYLTREFIESGMDTRHLVRLICRSRTYQLSLETNEWNEDDQVNFSHAKARRLPAEVLYDAIHAATGSIAKIPGVPEGTRAAAIPDAGVELPDGFLANLGKPARESACECERSSDLQLGPVMALVSGPTVGNALSDPQNALASLVATEKDDRKLIDHIFMRILNRHASEGETDAALEVWNRMTEEHRALEAELAAYEKELAPEIAKREAARKAAIIAARDALANFDRDHAGEFARANAEHADRMAAAEEALRGHEALFPSRVHRWEQTFREGGYAWNTFVPDTLDATQGAQLQVLDDGSILAGGPNGKGDYILEGDASSRVTGLRLEAIPDDSLPQKGPGRAESGNFVLSELELHWTEPARPELWRSLESWDFSESVAGWTSNDHLEVTVADGALALESRGDDPTLISPPIEQVTGAFVVEVSLQHDGRRPVELFWATDREPEFAAARGIRGEIVSDGKDATLHRFYFTTDSPLRRLRIDPDTGSGKGALLGVRLHRGARPAGHAVALRNARASASQKGFDVGTAIDGKAPEKDNGWAIHPEIGKPQVATFEVGAGLDIPEGARFRFVLKQNYTDGSHSLGRFRLSTTASEQPIDLTPPDEITSILAVEAGSRNAEQNAKLLDYFRERDEAWKAKRAALDKAREPLPAHPEGQKLTEALAAAAEPLPVDPKLARLRHDVELSGKQLEQARLTGAQDLGWALINTPAFLFNH